MSAENAAAVCLKCDSPDVAEGRDAESADERYERETLAYWLRRSPGCESVTVTVRKGGEVVRFLRLDADGTVTPLEVAS
jgi:hypothetical protein